MVKFKVYVGSKQRGEDLNSYTRAENLAKAIIRNKANRQVYIYEVVNGGIRKTRAKWVDGARVV
jgi:hypothetical protein